MAGPPRSSNDSLVSGLAHVQSNFEADFEAYWLIQIRKKDAVFDRAFRRMVENRQNMNAPSQEGGGDGYSCSLTDKTVTENV